MNVGICQGGPLDGQELAYAGERYTYADVPDWSARWAQVVKLHFYIWVIDHWEYQG